MKRKCVVSLFSKPEKKKEDVVAGYSEEKDKVEASEEKKSEMEA